jgi:hypothetical protein
MSQTVAVALIAVAGTLGSGVLSYVAARRNTQVQLASVNLELHRLRSARAAEVRSERRELYHEFLAAAYDLEEVVRGFGKPSNLEEYANGVTSFGRSYTNVVLLGSEEVVKTAEALNAAVTGFAAAMHTLATNDAEERSLEKLFEVALGETEEDWMAARNRLVQAIRKDLGSSEGSDLGDPTSD